MRVATEPPAGAAVLGTLCEGEEATKMARRTIGILGGMGPLATAEFYRRIVVRTPARYDQEHLRVVIDADPAVPDRTAALLGQGPDPTPHLVAAARRLEAAGVDFLVVPCNTAHAFLPNVQAAIAVPILDMIDEVAAEVARRFPPETPIGLLATEGTIASRLHERALSRYQLHPVVPDNDRQQLLTAAIGRVKRGLLDERTCRLVSDVLEWLTTRGVAAAIVGCTELSVLLAASEASLPLVDAMDVLAAATVAIGLGLRPLPPRLASPCAVFS